MATKRRPAGTKKRPSIAANETGHGSRAIWSGSVGFGLVQIPVAIHSRERNNDLVFHQVDRRDGALVGYERVNKNTQKPVAWGDVAKGYEIQKGQIVIVADEDFEKANVLASRTIEIQDFVRADEIPRAYDDRPYVLLPEKRGNKAYAVLRDALAQKGLAGVALVVIRTRQHLCAVLPEGDMLTLELLRFAHEVKPLEEVAGRAEKAATLSATAKEIALAAQLIDSMIVPWDSAKYADTYRDDLLAAIRQKAETGAVEARHVPAARRAAAIDLVSLLEKSLAGTKKKRTKPRAA